MRWAAEPLSCQDLLSEVKSARKKKKMKKILYARGRLSSPTPSNGCTKTDNGAVGMFNNVHHDKEKMQRRRRALAGQGRPTRDRGCAQRHRAAVGHAPRTGNRLSIYCIWTRILHPSMMTLDGTAREGAG